MSPFAGSFSCGIPIEVPPFHGLEPRMSLGYSSEGRNGLVGVGWGLSGFSTIGRDGTKTTLSPIVTAPANPAAPERTFRWGRSSAVDTLGNTVSYTGSCVAREDCYPDSVSYNG